MVYQHVRKTRRTVHLTYGGGPAAPFLVLTNHPDESPDGEPIKLDQVGISHFSFTVPDPKLLAQELQAKGVSLAGPIESWTDAQGTIASHKNRHVGRSW